ncbi:hypothetical protein F4779DRAFT_610358 [Xylariaceae sp. FL0662B]|nr:hypothetical protein F4779DRAFT_610358 [Xylariaceae sp. FL0662B]
MMPAMSPSRKSKPQSSLERSNPPPRQKACAACVRAKRRCDLQSPTCTRCFQREIQCRYPPERSYHGNTHQRSKVQTAEPMADFWNPSLSFEDLMATDTIMTPMLTGLFPICENDLLFSNSAQGGLSDVSYMQPESSGAQNAIVPSHNVAYVDNRDVIPISPSLFAQNVNGETERRSAMLIRNHFQYCMDQLISAPRRMVLENCTPWSHPFLYRDHLPRCMQDVYAHCALYMAKNAVNAPVVLPVISARASELASKPPPSTPRELLAHVHALLLYSIMQIFDGDIYARVSAEYHMSALEAAAISLLPFVSFPSPEVTPLPLISLDLSDAARHFWEDWVFQESARRSCLLTFIFIRMYRMLQGQVFGGCETVPVMDPPWTWTLSARLWEAGDAVQFHKGWCEQRHVMARIESSKFVMDGAIVEDIDTYSKMLLTTVTGIDAFKAWLIGRGGWL